MYSEKGGHAAWTSEKRDAAAVIVPALPDSGPVKAFLERSRPAAPGFYLDYSDLCLS